MDNNITPRKNKIEQQIFLIRNVYVMLDCDLAEIYQTETKFINRAVKRNLDRFPDLFVFQLTSEEWKDLKINNDLNLRFQFGTSNDRGGRRTLPYAFTEQGVAMLSSVLKSKTAVQVSVMIMNAFVEMRKILILNSGLIQRIEGIERKQIQTERQFEQIFQALNQKDNIPKQGVFFEGQIFDAYELTSRIIRTAKTNIVLIDN
jgi:hypothetical protein